MGYMHIDNLYKNDRVLRSGPWVYVLEKLHGTSAHVSWHPAHGIQYFAGAGNRDAFAGLFDEARVRGALELLGDPVTIYGEYYGGGGRVGMGMRDTYGPVSRFAAFDVQIGGRWSPVPEMSLVCGLADIEVVEWRQVPATLEAVDAERDRESAQAIRNGMGPGKVREGVVIRPLLEAVDELGRRVMAKHKGAAFAERVSTPHRPVDLARLQAQTDAGAIAAEWVVPMRLEHVLQRFPEDLTIRDTRRVIDAMIEDVRREGEGELVWSPAVGAAIARATAALFQRHLEGRAGVTEVNPH